MSVGRASTRRLVVQLASACGLYVRVLASGFASTIRYDTKVCITTRSAAAITDLWYVFYLIIHVGNVKITRTELTVITRR